ncbi:pseudouridine synthase [Methylocystis parvus]|uniref:Pseudouridine synthase n=2 Tax=Methylocystis parvus TaxID=134 RepID=A0A6B8MDE9_9HYPH|nr:pseudouridine synthase [Methylocystis parvus]
MADKKPTKRSGAPGGDRPMRRRDSTSAPGKAPRKFSDDKPRGAKAAKLNTARPNTARPKFDAPKKARPAKSKPAPTPVEKTSAFEGERIAKAMARAGVCSRRDAEQWIAEGRVDVNGETLTSPAVNVTEADKITIDGEPMQARERTRLFLFHKPAGLVTTASDPEGRRTVFAFLDERHPDLPRLVSVGRLDINTEGLLLLTNDGGLARTLELPATGWTRRYRVRVHGETDQARLDELKKGVTVDDVTYAPIEARLERVQGANAWIAMSLTEGKNREVKRVTEHLGLDVTRLIRVSYGPFQLGDLAEGSVEEVKLKILREQLGKSLAELAGVDFSSPLREATPAEEQEQRQRVERRSRKHVSVLRKERDEQSEKGPRARVMRGATADRKGRAVLVERVTLTARKSAVEEETPSRNAKRFEAMRAGRRPRRDEADAERPTRGGGRGGRNAGFAPDDRRRGENRRPRFEGERSERPTRPPRERSEAQPHRAHGDVRAARDHARSRPPEGERTRFERRPHRDKEEAPRGGRGGGERQERNRNFEKPPREGQERNAGRSGRAAGDHPRHFDKPRGEGGSARGGGERQTRARSGEGRPPREGPARSARSGPPRKGPPKGPPKGRGPGKGPAKGPRRPRGE